MEAPRQMKNSKRKVEGRPARKDVPARLVVRVAGELKRWLAHRAIDEGRDMGQIVAEALDEYRRSARKAR
jgi:hypothetical protein